LKVDAAISTDVLVIGGGAAGSFAAIRARQLGADVLLVTKGLYGRDGASTWMAGPALQAALYSPDSAEVHAHDVIRVGRYIADQDLVHAYTRRLPELIGWLEQWGMRFRKENGRFVMTRYPGETYPRVVETARPAISSGPQYRSIIPRETKRLGVGVGEDLFVNELLSHQGTVCGALAIDIREGKLVALRAKSVILAAGGHMGCYPRTFTPTASGDGSAMAYRAGAILADMEFTDFYTYASVWPSVGRGDDWPALIAYSLSGVLYNRKGEEYMKRYTGARRVPPRAAALELRAGNGSSHGGVYLSVRHLPRNLLNDFVAETGHGKWIDGLKGIGFDLANDAVEIAPAGITSFGGCKINAKCETNLDGLYAAGEVASGHQGAYVLVGNMVGSSASMGCIAGEQAAARAAGMKLPVPDASRMKEVGSFLKSLLERRKDGSRPFEVRKAIQHILNERAYLVGRTEGGLQKGLEEIAEVRSAMIPRLRVSNHDVRFNQEWLQALEVINEAQIGELILGAALRRKETRGCHYRDDYPVESDEWLKRITVSNKNGLAAFTEEPVVLQHVRPPAKVA